MASLMERLMKLDRDKLLEVPIEKVKACHLSKVAGEEVERYFITANSTKQS